MDYHYTTTDTYSLASLPLPTIPIFGAHITFDVHHSNNPKQVAIAALYEELLLSGCQGMDRNGFLDRVNRLGASINIHAELGRVSICLKSTTSNARALIRLFELMITTPTFATFELRRAKTLLINQLKEYEEEARSRAQEIFVNHLFAPTDRRHTPAPEVLRKAISSITTADITHFHTSVLSERATVSIAAAEPVITAFLTSINRITKGVATTPPKRTHQTIVPTKHLSLLSIPSKQNIEFSLGGPLPLTMHHPDYVPFLFGLNVLGKWGGFAGRLMSTVREKEGLTYGIYSRTETVSGNETGYWRVMTFFSPQHAATGLTSTIREITNLQKKGITESEFQRFRTILMTQITLLQDAPMRALESLHRFHTAGFTLDEMQAHQQKFQTVDRETINRALKKYLTLDTLVIVGAGPVATVQKSLEKLF